MPINRQRYADNWSTIALSVKEAALWRCRHCGKQCLRPGEKPSNLTRSEWTMATLSVHHANFIPEDNRPENLGSSGLSVLNYQFYDFITLTTQGL